MVTDDRKKHKFRAFLRQLVENLVPFFFFLFPGQFRVIIHQPEERQLHKITNEQTANFLRPKTRIRGGGGEACKKKIIEKNNFARSVVQPRVVTTFSPTPHFFRLLFRRLPPLESLALYHSKWWQIGKRRASWKLNDAYLFTDNPWPRGRRVGSDRLLFRPETILSPLRRKFCVKLTVYHLGRCRRYHVYSN